MSKKILFILGITAFILAILLLFLLFRKPPGTDTPGGAYPYPGGGECQTFQSNDPTKPCYVKPSPGGGTVPEPGVPVPTATTTGQTGGVMGCDSSIAPERDDCIAKLAKEKRDSDICDAIQGSFARTMCKMEVSGSTSTAIDTSLLPKMPTLYSAPTAAPTPQPSVPTSYQPTSGIGDFLDNIIKEASERALERATPADPSITAEGFYERSAAVSELSVYSVVPLQAKPGDIVKAYGGGFQKSDNTIHIDNKEIKNLSSVDGMTILFTVPSDTHLGTHEVWVTNERGSSKGVLENPTPLIVTSNPKPLPKITSVTPVNPMYTDKVTLHGENLSGLIEVSTSLGSAGKSLSFKIEDLEFTEFVIAEPKLRGQLVPVYVQLVTDAGYNPEPFIFNVQF